MGFVTHALGVEVTHRVHRGCCIRAFLIAQHGVINVVSLSSDALGARTLPVEIRQGKRCEARQLAGLDDFGDLYPGEPGTLRDAKLRLLG